LLAAERPSVRRRSREVTLRIVLVAVVSIALATPRPALAGEDAAAGVEQRTIEALIESVAHLTDATFLRNGKSYPSSSAARFLREKWRSRQSEVRSAEDFIDRVASSSSTTGKPYLIRFANGREVSSAEYLRGELAKLCEETP
jgi:Family of unknown function (DUF5329)